MEIRRDFHNSGSLVLAVVFSERHARQGERRYGGVLTNAWRGEKRVRLSVVPRDINVSCQYIIERFLIIIA